MQVTTGKINNAAMN